MCSRYIPDLSPGNGQNLSEVGHGLANRKSMYLGKVRGPSFYLGTDFVLGKMRWKWQRDYRQVYIE